MKLAMESKFSTYGIQYEPSPPVLYAEFQNGAADTAPCSKNTEHFAAAAAANGIDSKCNGGLGGRSAVIGEHSCKCVYCSKIHKKPTTKKGKEPPQRKRVKLYQCKGCSHSFQNVVHLRKHSRMCRNWTAKLGGKRCLHGDCAQSFSKLCLLLSHLKGYHITEAGLTFEFYSHDEFNNWRNKYSNDFYLIKTFRNAKAGIQYRYYVCQTSRSGGSSSSSSSSGSSGVPPTNCPCQGKIFVTERGNGVVVNYLPHSENCQKSLRQESAAAASSKQSPPPKLKETSSSRSTTTTTTTTILEENLLQEDKLRLVLSTHKFNDIDADKDIESLKKSIRYRISELNECVRVGGDVKSLLSIEYVLKELLKTYSKTEELHNAPPPPNNYSDEEEKLLASLVSQHESFTSPLRDANDVNKLAFNVGPYGISFLHLKSLDYNIPLTECTLLKSVAPDFRKGWLYDTIIDAFLYRLCKPHPNAMFLETAVSQIINSNSLNSLRMQLGDKQLANIEKIFVAINPNGKHWVLLVVKPKSKQIEIYDPTSKKKTFNHAVMKFVKLLICVLLNDFGSNEFWDIVSPKHVVQKGNYNCGIYVCWYAERILQDKNVTSNFSGNDFRKYIYDFIENRDEAYGIHNGDLVNGH